jgi:hypothetical protein
MRRLNNRYVHHREDQEGIEAVSLMISLVVAVMVIAVIWMILPDPKLLDRVDAQPTALENAEVTGGVVYQVGEDPARVRLNITVYDKDDAGVPDASVEVTGPGFAKITNTTNKFGKTVIVVTFNLPTSAGDFFTIKASGGDSGLGGEVTTKVAVMPK